MSAEQASQKATDAYLIEAKQGSTCHNQGYILCGFRVTYNATLRMRILLVGFLYVTSKKTETTTNAKKSSQATSSRVPSL